MLKNFREVERNLYLFLEKLIGRCVCAKYTVRTTTQLIQYPRLKLLTKNRFLNQLPSFARRKRLEYVVSKPRWIHTLQGIRIHVMWLSNYVLIPEIHGGHTKNSFCMTISFFWPYCSGHSRGSFPINGFQINPNWFGMIHILRRKTRLASNGEWRVASPFAFLRPGKTMREERRVF